ncbi:MAG: outer membrane protein assembly factor BamA [Xanthobacteraceae bacterium]|nr:outer membrane protein assembly factor BamA [Xanthobacteraceae bacterium]MCW5677260.1 outer membrane protein assembly factor BamA [Xanthobacteraceae bacterium]
MKFGGVRVIRKLGAAAVLAVTLVCGIAAGSIATSTVAQAQTVTAVDVVGNQRVDADTIRSYVKIRPGERADAQRIDDALRALFAIGLFEDVNIQMRGSRLVVTVREAQIINRVVFEGNRRVKDDILTAEVQSKPRGALSRATVQADVQRIIEVYRRSGRYDITVEPQLIDRASNRVDLIFQIKEGDKTTIKTINFTGNNVYSSARLRDVINTTQTNWLSWLRNSDVYDPDRVNADQELLRRFYLKNGYADFRILSATVDLDRKNNGFVLNFVLDEGVQYRFGNVDVVSNVRDLDPSSARALIRGRSGEVYNAEQVEKTVELMTIELANRGYAFAQVRPRGDRDFQGRLINVTYVIDEGARVYIERINIRSNTRTREYVIRREFDIVEGDPYNRVMVDRAERRLKNLGYFKSVKITNEPGSAPDRVVLNVDVEEQLTGEFSIAAGYSTADGIIGELTIGERNFLGRGQYVRTSLQYGERVKGIEFSFTEPYFMDYRLAAGFDLFYKSTQPSEFVAYGIDTVGGTLRATARLNEEITMQVRYSAFQREIVAGSTTYLVSNAILSSLFTPYLTSSVGYTLIYNSLDNNKEPTSGFYAQFAQDFAGLGGDVKYVKTTAEARYYRPITGDFVGMVRATGGHIFAWGGDTLRFSDHFNNSHTLVRGFATQGFGPMDVTSGLYSNANTIGGATYWAATAELQFPLWFMPKEIGIKTALFTDVGQLWGYQGNLNPANLNLLASSCGGPTVCLYDADKIRASAGVSLIWSSPFGPLRFDFAVPLSKDDRDRTQFFRFGGGAKF